MVINRNREENIKIKLYIKKLIEFQFTSRIIDNY